MKNVFKLYKFGRVARKAALLTEQNADELVTKYLQLT